MGEPLRWGVLGAARIAREQVVPAIRRSGTGEVLAVSSASGRAGAYADDLDIPRAYDAHEDLLADEAVEAVYVALPNSEHAAWIERAARAGKHVLCEKPLVLGAGELDRVTAARSEGGVQVVEAFMYRHHPQLAAVRRLLADGAIGALVALQARLHFPLPRGAEPDIRLRPELGGGSLLDLGCYPVDLAGLLTGRDPDEVAAVAFRDGTDGVDVRTAGVLRYGDVVASFDCSFDAPFQGTATLIGTAGRLTLASAFRADAVGGTGIVLVEREGAAEQVAVDGDQYAEQARAFTARVRTGGDPEGHDVLTRRTALTLERLARAAGLPWPASS